jgi:alkylation response protein AidB-like acyl-CoA dehydrogenase
MTLHNDDYEMVRDQARRFLNDAMQPERLKQLLETAGSFDAAAWASAAEFGWPAAAATEEQGGLGLGWRGVCVLAEELGRKTASIPLVASAAVANLLLADADSAEHASALVSGERHACLALMMHGEAGLALAPSCQLRDSLLYGQVPVTAFAASADYALLPAREGAAFRLVMVALAQGGVSRSVRPTIDNSRAAAALSFDGAHALTVASGDAARGALWRLASLAALATAFEQVGAAQVCLDMACAYALERKAFGQVIGRFQAIKGKLADMYVRIEMARGCAIDALDCLERGDPAWQGLAAAARVAAIDAYEIAARENIQTHGAIGVTWEAMPHHHYRRSRALALELGVSAMWRERLLSETGFGLAA